MSSLAWRRANRRKFLPGYPIDRPFETKEEVVAYLSHKRITCLICGKRFRSLGNHLAMIHGMDPDAYRERYRIPWTYSLSCEETIQVRGDATKAHMDLEILEANLENGREAHKLLNTHRARPFESPGKPKHPLTIGPDGALETFTDRRERLKTHRGTPEFEEKMRNRAISPRSVQAITTYWKGRRQSLDHLRARMKAIHGKEWEPAPPKTQEPQEIICRECGTPFSYMGHHPPAFCSTVCRNKSLAARRVAAIAQRILENPRVPCSLCGDLFHPSPDQVQRIQEGLPVYCGAFCRGNANAAGRSRPRG